MNELLKIFIHPVTSKSSPDEQRIHGAIAIHFSIAIYFFIMLGICIDKYFLPAINRICEALDITQVSISDVTSNVTSRIKFLKILYLFD